MLESVRARHTEIGLWYDNADVSADVCLSIESLNYTDKASDACDSVDIKLNAQEDKWRGGWFPKKGATLHPSLTGFDWDEQGDRQHIECGQFLLDDVQYTDAPGVLTLGAVSKPSDTDFSEQERTDIWKNTSIRQIGMTIAGRYGLGFVFDAGDYEIEKREQNESDSEFYQTLCKNYGLILKVYAEKLWVYDREQYKAKDTVMDVHRWNMKPGSFTYKTSLTDTYTGGKFAYTDQDKDVDITASMGGGKRILKLNQYASSVADAGAQLAAALNNANHGGTTVSFSMMGNFTLFAGSCIKIDGFGGEIDGKYFVEETEREVSRSGFTLKVSASKVEPAFSAADVGGSVQAHVDENGSGTKGTAAQAAAYAVCAPAKAVQTDPAGGDAVELVDCPLYASCLAETAAATVTGTYYLYDGVEMAERYRVTDAPEKCGCRPMRQNVAGWVDKSCGR